MLLLGQVGLFSMLTLALFFMLRKLSSRLLKKKDFISELPDDILTSIIARVRIKSAIRTSVLSKRWRNVHRSVDTIYLNCRLLGDDNRDICHDSKIVMESVNRFLRDWSGSKIRTLRLRCCLSKSVSQRRLKQCFCSLRRLGIDKLELNPRCPNWGGSSNLSFSFHLVSEMPSLRYFHLSSCVLQRSTTQCCNSLKIINLSYVRLLPGAVECVLSSCLGLEHLGINYCNSPSKLSFRGSNLQLKKLDILSCTGVKEVELYASNLVVFDFVNADDDEEDVNNSDVNFIFDHVPQLESVSLPICERYNSVLRKLANELHNLKSLSLVTSGGDIYQGSSCRLMGINIFNKLRQLDIQVYFETGVNHLLLTQLLQRCPVLQDLGWHTQRDILEYDDIPPQGEKQGVVVFRHRELKKVELSGFIGTKDDIEFALYILKSATGLEKMVISRDTRTYCGYGRWSCPSEAPWSEETLSMMQQQLQGQAVSTTAQLIIQQEPIVEDDYYRRFVEHDSDVYEFRVSVD